MTDSRALIIDDEADIRELLSLTLLRMGIDCDPAKDVAEARSLLAEREYNLCLTDMRLPDGDGMEIVRLIQTEKPQLPVAVITAHGSTELAVEAMKSGAFDFLNKPIDLQQLRKLVDAAVLSSRTDTETKSELLDIIGQSEALEKLKKAIKKLARSQAPVYISGESGTGKELAARSIHQLSARSDKPFVPVNCGAIPTELVESEFFGYKKGAFTGALHDSEGLFQAANGGTLFLDEVADLPLAMQVKILRAIQEKAIRPVGTQAEVNVDVRVLSATHKNLHELVERGEFRQDLFYRLNVIQLDVPPLRERQDDIPLLCNFLLEKLTPEGERSKLTAKALKKLKDYHFPGNVRELENLLERAYTLCESDMIDADDLVLASTTVPSTTGSGKTSKHFHTCMNYESIDEYLSEIEKEILLDALEHERWNKTNTAKTLGISFRSFRYRLSKLGLDEDD